MLDGAPENKALPASPGAARSGTETALAENTAHLLKAGRTIREEWRFLHDQLRAAAGIIEATGQTASAEEFRQRAQDSVARVETVVSTQKRVDG